MTTNDPGETARMALTTSHWPADTSTPILETTVGGVLRQTAEAAPDQIGLVAAWPGRPQRQRWSYAQMLEEAEQAARALLNRFTPGERVAVWAPNIPEWLFLQFGAAFANITLVTVNPAYRPKELAYLLGQSQSVGIFLVPEYRGNPMLAALEEVRPQLPTLREVIVFTDWQAFCAIASPTQRLPEISADAPAQVQYTSGTTGAPKGALLHHRGLTNNSRLIAQQLRVEPSDPWINANPLFHISGSGFSSLGAVQAQATQVLCPFDPALMLELMEAERVTVCGAAATMLDLLMRHPDRATRNLSTLRTVFVGGMTVSPELVRRVEATLGVRVLIGYGQTEACGLTHHGHPDDAPQDRAETIGRPLPQVEVKIADPTIGTPVPSGQIGEICVRGYQVMTGYLDMPEATVEAIDAQGWLHTGDLGMMDERGYCRIEGRLKDMIIRGGENIYPREIEELLLTHTAIADVAVVGVPDQTYGEQVVAVVQLKAGSLASAAELTAFCRTHLASYKAPQQWLFVEAFPRTPLGKIQKFVLREQLGQQRAGSTDG